MERILHKASGSFVRLHGIFGVTHKGTILFTDDALLITKEKRIAQSHYSKDDAVDVLYFSDIADFTCSFELRYQITTKTGQKCNLILFAPVDFSPEAFIGTKTTFYKNLLEKKAGVETKSESAIFAVLTAKHVSGLPIAEGVPVKITANKERLLFIHNAQEISLSAEKIIDVSIKTDTEIQTSYVSSIGSALLGARLFGTAGAIIGGQARERRSAIEYHFLIVTYTKQNEQAYLSFQVDDTRSAHAIASFFNNSSPTPTRIDL